MLGILREPHPEAKAPTLLEMTEIITTENQGQSILTFKNKRVRKKKHKEVLELVLLKTVQDSIFALVDE